MIKFLNNFINLNNVNNIIIESEEEFRTIEINYTNGYKQILKTNNLEEINSFLEKVGK